MSSKRPFARAAVINLWSLLAFTLLALSPASAQNETDLNNYVDRVKDLVLQSRPAGLPTEPGKLPQVKFQVTHDGLIKKVEIVKPSLSPELDEAALATVRSCSPLPPPPSGAPDPLPIDISFDAPSDLTSGGMLVNAYNAESIVGATEVLTMVAGSVAALACMAGALASLLARNWTAAGKFVLACFTSIVLMSGFPGIVGLIMDRARGSLQIAWYLAAVFALIDLLIILGMCLLPTFLAFGRKRDDRFMLLTANIVLLALAPAVSLPVALKLAGLGLGYVTLAVIALGNHFGAAPKAEESAAPSPPQSGETCEPVAEEASHAAAEQAENSSAEPAADSTIGSSSDSSEETTRPDGESPDSAADESRKDSQEEEEEEEEDDDEDEQEPSQKPKEEAAPAPDQSRDSSAEKPESADAIEATAAADEPAPDQAVPDDTDTGESKL